MTDSILEELHETRKRLAARWGNDLTAIFRHLGELHHRELKDCTVTSSPNAVSSGGMTTDTLPADQSDQIDTATAAAMLRLSQDRVRKIADRLGFIRQVGGGYAYDRRAVEAYRDAPHPPGRPRNGKK